jgi:CheY-like chemotaxis protein
MPLRILLAEDNEINRKVALRMLQGFGYQADVAANGLEALDAVQRQPYDLVLMDIQMPEMDGLEATRRIVRDFPAATRPRLIAMSANAMREDMDTALQAGVDDYVVKPVAVPLLRAALERTGELKAQRERGPAVASAAEHDLDALADVLDEEHLGSFVELDPTGEFVRSLVESFAVKGRESLVALRRFVAADDAAAVGALAHQLKGNSATLGVKEMARVCGALEELALAGALQGAGQLLDDCERRFATGLSALAVFLAAHQQSA